MSRLFHQRCLEPERMDIEPLDRDDTQAILHDLERVNIWLGGIRAMLFHIERFSRHWEPGEQIRFIDWGTGAADIPRALVRWGRRNGFCFEVVGIDQNGPVLDCAREACRDYPEIRLLQADFNEFPETAPPFDYALSSLCLHHLRTNEIIAFLQKSHRLARRGMILNDLRRSVRAWMWIWFLTRFGAHPVVQHDAPLSVRRAFTVQELKHLAQQAGLSYLKVNTHFGYRLTLAGEKNS